MKIEGIVGRLVVPAVILFAASPRGEARAWTQSVTGPNGAVSVAIDPAEPRRVFAADLPGATVYASRDAGATWVASPVTGFSVGQLAVGAGGSGPLYAAGEEAASTTTRPGNYGIWRSDDDGASWQRLFDAGSCLPPPYACPSALVAVSPDLPGVVYAQSDTSAVFSSSVELLKSVDGGRTWRPVNPGEPSEALEGEGTLGLGPGGALYDSAGYPFVDVAPPGLAFRSFDEGASWDQIPPPTDRPALGLAVDAGDPRIVFWASLGSLYRSIDGGENWSASPLVGTETASFGVVADLTIPGVEYFWSHEQVWRTDDTGSTWQALPPLDSPIVAIAAGGGRLYVATRRGVSAFHQVQVLAVPPATVTGVRR